MGSPGGKDLSSRNNGAQNLHGSNLFKGGRQRAAVQANEVGSLTHGQRTQEPLLTQDGRRAKGVATQSFRHGNSVLVTLDSRALGVPGGEPVNVEPGVVAGDRGISAVRTEILFTNDAKDNRNIFDGVNSRPTLPKGLV